MEKWRQYIAYVLLLAAFLANVISPGPVQATAPVKILIDGKSPDPELQTHIIDGEVFVSLETLAELLGADVTWSPDKSFVSISTIGPPRISVSQSNSSIVTPKAITVYITKSGSKYHLAGCRHLSKSMIPISLEEAKAKGFTPCGVCKPPS